MTSQPRIQELAAFAHSLEEELDWEFDHEEFDDRFFMQKYVKFAESFGYDSPYSYGIHLHGPYSPMLAEDYYDQEFHEELEETEAGLAYFDLDGFVDFIEGKSQEYLEVAATVKAIYDRYESSIEQGLYEISDVFERVSEIKRVSQSEVGDIFSDLQEHDIV